MSTERSEWRHLEAIAKVLQMKTKHFRNCEIVNKDNPTLQNPARFLHRKPAYCPRIRLRRILEFWHWAFAQGRAVPVPKRWSE